jgi:hypothetical protein
VEVEDFAAAGSGGEGKSNDGEEIGAAAVAAGIEQARDFVEGEEAVAGFGWACDEEDGIFFEPAVFADADGEGA